MGNNAKATTLTLSLQLDISFTYTLVNYLFLPILQNYSS